MRRLSCILQIVTLNECGQEIKKQLREHQKRCTAIIEEYSLGLREKGDRLEDMWSSINRKRKRKHATEVIRSFSTVGEEIDSFQAVRFKQAPRLPRITYLHKGSTGKKLPTNELVRFGEIGTLKHKLI